MKGGAGISSKRQSVRELTETLFLKDVLKSIRSGVAIVDATAADYPLTYVNPAFEQLTGYKASECLGRNCRFLQGREIDQAASKILKKALAEQRDAQVLLRNYRKNGELFWNELYIAPLHFEGAVATHFIGFQQDVTERVNERKKHRRFRAALDVVDEAVFLIDVDGWRISDINDAAMRMLGYTREELLSLPPDKISPLSLDVLKAAYREVIAKNTATGLKEAWLVRNDGTHVPVEVGRYPLHTDETSLVIGIARDISERKRAQQMIVEGEQRYQQMFDGNPLPMWVYDLETLAFLAVNQASVSHYGYSREQFLAMTILNIRPAEDNPAVLGSFAQAYTGFEHAGIWRHQVSDGRIIEVEITSHPVDFAGRAAKLVLANDVTARLSAVMSMQVSNERFEMLARTTSDIVWDWNLITHKRWWNGNITSLLGYSASEMADGPAFWGVHPDDRLRVDEKLRAFIESRETLWTDEYRFRHRDGHYLDILDRGSAVRDAYGRPERLIGAMMDVTARRQAERALQRQVVRQSQIAVFGQQALACTDVDSLFQQAVQLVSLALNAPYCKIVQVGPGQSGFTVKAVAGWQADWIGRRMSTDAGDQRRSLVDFVTTSNQPVIVDDFRAETRFSPSEMLQTHHVVSAVAVPISGALGVYGAIGAYASCPNAFDLDSVTFVATLANTLQTAIERGAANERMAYLAQFDGLTDLPNRNLLRDRIEQALTQARRNATFTCLMFIDIDYFKTINDTFGHAAGDQLLQVVADRVKSCVRSVDTVGRFGGDEFIVVLPELGRADDATVVAQKILDALGCPIHLSSQQLEVSASIGIAVFPTDGSSVEELLRNADAAMYQAKQSGRGSYSFFTEELNQRNRHRRDLERDLRLAIEREEFEVFYQAQAEVRTGKIVGAEALVRWHHPQRGLLSPDQFIKVAEETALVIPIGRWVLKQACQQVAKWRAEGHGKLSVAVNVSPVEIKRGDFTETLKVALATPGLDASMLEIELTETLLVDGAEIFIQVLNGLKQEGVSLAIDDFGTGYSSLSYLKRFPIDRLKIDRSFIEDSVNLDGTDGKDAAIVCAIIAMAHQLGLNVVAEGVETKQQAAFLARSQCDFLQGYLIEKPCTAADFDVLLREQDHCKSRWMS